MDDIRKIEMDFVGYAIEVYPKRYGERIDFSEIKNALRAQGVHADIEVERNQVWCDPVDIGAVVDVLNSLGYETDEDGPDDDRS